MRLPAGDYRLASRTSDDTGYARAVFLHRDSDVDLNVACNRTFSPGEWDALRAWVSRESRVLSGEEASPGTAEDVVVHVFGAASVVGLGEGTHGTHEFFVAKDRIARALIEHLGFRVALYETTEVAAQELDQYVQGGKPGPAAKVLASHEGIVWQTEEMAAFFDWMRVHNASVPPPRRVHVKGLSSEPARRFGAEGSSPLAIADAKDREMADTVRRTLDSEHPGSKAILWAHNGHVSKQWVGDLGVRSMGAYLKEAFSERYVAVGSLFGRGSFQAIDGRRPDADRAEMEEFTLGPPPPDTVEALLGSAGKGMFLLDLRGRSGIAREWCDGANRTRSVGGRFFGEAAMYTHIRPARDFDVLLYVGETTRARPLAR
jgi:erythromycin esterase-like protein